ncbi:enolase-phosphatase E1-like [Rosa chinensis]|uniref:enolase-phosphatase E1-like n=1 Tax=Rosa chinensis TaxID=74649 RepID=UPI000D096A61|nr:enolase-phosphatase E1-like [Rosa chinensis]
MAALAEPAFVSEQEKKEEKNRKREAKNKEHNERIKMEKEKEEKKNRDKELQLIANFRNNDQNHKQLPRIPVTHAVASAKPSQAPKANVKAAQTPLPVASAKMTVPTSTIHASTVHPTPVAWAKVVPNRTTNASKKTDFSQKSQTQSVAPAKAAVPSLPIASGKSLTDASKMSNINHYQQQPAANGGADMTFYVGQIPVKTTAINNPLKANILFGRKETQATTVVEKTQATTVVMTYASALQNKAADAQKNLGTYNAAASTFVSMTTSVTTTLPVVPQTNQPAKEEVVVPATKTTNGQNGPVRPMSSTTTSVSSERSYYTGTQRNGNGPDQKNYENGRVINGGGNGSSQKYYGKGSGQRYYGNGSAQRYNGNGYGQRYYRNGRYTNGSQENQKKQAKPKPVVDAEGWQVVENRRRV